MLRRLSLISCYPPMSIFIVFFCLMFLKIKLDLIKLFMMSSIPFGRSFKCVSIFLMLISPLTSFFKLSSSLSTSLINSSFVFIVIMSCLILYDNVKVSFSLIVPLEVPFPLHHNFCWLFPLSLLPFRCFLQIGLSVLWMVQRLLQWFDLFHKLTVLIINCFIYLFYRPSKLTPWRNGECPSSFVRFVFKESQSK